jgi:TolA-binding protein
MAPAASSASANPEGWEKAQPLVKTHLTELARHYHASAQKTKASADYQEAVRWYRDYITSYPNEPDTARNHFLLGELLYEDSRFAEAAVEYEKVAYGTPEHDKSRRRRLRRTAELHAELEKRAAAAHKLALQRTGRGQLAALREGLPTGFVSRPC